MHSNLGSRFWNVIIGMTSQLAYQEQQAFAPLSTHTHTHTHTFSTTLSLLDDTAKKLSSSTLFQPFFMPMSSSQSSSFYLQSPDRQDTKRFQAFRVEGAQLGHACLPHLWGPPWPPRPRNESRQPLSITPGGFRHSDQHKHVLRSSWARILRTVRFNMYFLCTARKVSLIVALHTHTHTHTHTHMHTR